MDRIRVMEYLEENKDFLFPNKKYTDEDIEDALIAAPDSFEMMMESISFRKPSSVQKIAVFPGSLGGGQVLSWKYLAGDTKIFFFWRSWCMVDNRHSKCEIPVQSI